MLLPLLLVEEMERRLEWGSGCAEGKKIDEERDEAVNLFGLGLLAEGDGEEDGLKWLVSG